MQDPKRTVQTPAASGVGARDPKTYEPGQFIEVASELQVQYIAKIFEIRNKRKKSFFRILWMYRPEDLPESLGIIDSLL